MPARGLPVEGYEAQRRAPNAEVSATGVNPHPALFRTEEIGGRPGPSSVIVRQTIC